MFLWKEFQYIFFVLTYTNNELRVNSVVHVLVCYNKYSIVYPQQVSPRQSTIGGT